MLKECHGIACNYLRYKPPPHPRASPVLPIFFSPQARSFACSLALSHCLENAKETSATQAKLFEKLQIIIHLGKVTKGDTK